jgi:hypothetical protein
VSITELGSEYEVSPQAIYGLLKRHNINIRPLSESQRKYELNENLFDQIDTEEKAYLLGFISAVGYLSKERGVLSIHLHSRDKDILMKINEVFGSNNSLKQTTVTNKSGAKTPLNYLRIYSKLICKRLSELEIQSMKTKYPNWLNQSLNRHFIRGFLDGDGSVSPDRKVLNFFGSKLFCESLIEVLKHECGLEKFVIKTEEDNLSVRVSIKGDGQLLRLYDYLYRDTKVFGERKKEAFGNLINLIEESRKKRNQIKERMCEHCEKPNFAKGMCVTHYHRNYRKRN